MASWLRVGHGHLLDGHYLNHLFSVRRNFLIRQCSVVNNKEEKKSRCGHMLGSYWLTRYFSQFLLAENASISESKEMLDESVMSLWDTSRDAREFSPDIVIFNTDPDYEIIPRHASLANLTPDWLDTRPKMMASLIIQRNINSRVTKFWHILCLLSLFSINSMIFLSEWDHLL